VWVTITTTLARELLNMVEVDLGIDWQEGQFVRTGAALFDDKLVNDNLHWLPSPALSRF
jgi:hypothetical protein